MANSGIQKKDSEKMVGAMMEVEAQKSMWSIFRRRKLRRANSQSMAYGEKETWWRKLLMRMACQGNIKQCEFYNGPGADRPESFFSEENDLAERKRGYQRSLKDVSGEDDQGKLFKSNVDLGTLEEQLISLGIGGMSSTFTEILERAFFPRILPPNMCKRLGLSHVRGMLLYGPPGTGKTLIARKITEIVNAKGPWILPGPEIFCSYIGQSEDRLKKIFELAFNDYIRHGSRSALHIIIIDEIDSIARKQRTYVGNDSDKVLRQFLSLIDRYNYLNNVFIIGTTSRRDLIDEALLRPGRLDLQQEVNFPNERGRAQILKVHSSELQKQGILQSDFDFGKFASMTENWSGAQLESLVRRALSRAIVRASDGLQNLDEEKLKVTEEDFLISMEDVKLGR
ncbi:vesicular-fusion protein sec18-like isoform X2 [Malania oleifera]|uniref:vesicular-fusion protein sec18-like isoform X2 n=1 Tax=Malania oleifera TaxID=397392 RepID=UPI0025AE6E32|nr:vesicular-fusion protein sec18-like isoform X2 [Malania oleifera]